MLVIVSFLDVGSIPSKPEIHGEGTMRDCNFRGVLGVCAIALRGLSNSEVRIRVDGLRYASGVISLSDICVGALSGADQRRFRAWRRKQARYIPLGDRFGNQSTCAIS